MIRAGRDRGSSAIEFAVIATSFLSLTFLGIQAGLYYYGHNVAQQAAREGVAQLRLARTPGEAAVMRGQVVETTTEYARQLGGTTLRSPAVTTEYADGQGRVHVTVTGTTVSLLPGVRLTTRADAYGTVERFRGPDGL